MLPPDAVSVTLVPAQIVLLGPAVAAILDTTVTIAVAVSEQAPFDIITEYVVVVVGFTVMDVIVAPVFHEYVFPPLAESV